MLYGWKENSMLTNCLAACTHLSSTVSQLFEPQMQKKSLFSRTAAHVFVSPGDVPVTITQYVAWMEKQFNSCQTPGSMYLSIFNSFRVIRCLSQSINQKVNLYSASSIKNSQMRHLHISTLKQPCLKSTLELFPGNVTAS